MLRRPWPALLGAGLALAQLGQAPDPAQHGFPQVVRVYRLGARHRTGWLSHPLAGAAVGWLIAVPAP
ncbi:hypothetical protein TthAA37_22230 (plasmid) [Thermus thermophilus]|uniref:Uncharacterized protein n=1 Tax=Thermus thermophilus TaxID=274 RepID=A0AAD1KVZ1_THETH|nr:hypothetical protein [Thermus thermophilus]BBL83334.1 hypothetical protein TthAA220_21180 [Thermus thermophilus]BBL85607.1 hypothetical protein TthAA229_20880 [Thermus thermophilus]BCZ88048.1 hypothetical protein TthAA11_22300 [Thermus thermophilus]BCZ90336.1 hypothetical protein TthAA22_21410 [Thermus thermophilus]BCZ93034.1 hypothetical protein TthAA37_22230 [Thermus thermophilus]